MKKLTITTGLIHFLSNALFAQFNLEFGLSANASENGSGIGFFVEPKYQLNERLDAGIYLGRNQLGIFNSDIVTPLLARATYRLSGRKESVFFTGGIGLYMQVLKSQNTNNADERSILVLRQGWEFTWGPSVSVPHTILQVQLPSLNSVLEVFFSEKNQLLLLLESLEIRRGSF